MIPKGDIVPGLSWAEFCHTDVRKHWAAQMKPPQLVLKNAVRIGALYTPVRKVWGPTAIISGWRCPALNDDPIVGGAKNSLHIEGVALDCIPTRVNIFDAFVTASHLPADVFPYDMLIFEYGEWIHMQCARLSSGTPRRLLKMKWSDSHEKTGKDYEPWDPTDPRVQLTRSLNGVHKGARP